jgi:hypothetical protein
LGGWGEPPGPDQSLQSETRSIAARIIRGKVPDRNERLAEPNHTDETRPTLIINRTPDCRRQRGVDIRKVPFPPERHGPDHHSIPPMTPGGRGHSCPPTRNSRVRPTARRTPGLSHHVFRVRLLRLPGDFARAAKSAGRLTFRPSGNSIKRELIRPPRPSITKRVPTGNRSGRPTLLPLTRPSYTTQRVQAYTLMNCPFVAKRRPASKWLCTAVDGNRVW